MPARNPIDRRDFIRTSTLAALAAGAAPETFAGGEEPKINLQYRRLGRTGFKISEISLGGSPVPPEAVFRKAVELGVNYVDTSSSYMNGNGERIIGEMIKGKRDKFYVATKFHAGRKKPKTRKELIAEAEGSLKRLDSDYVDILQIHGASTAAISTDEEMLAAFDTLKKAGKIRFTGLSCHRDPAGVLIPAIKSGHYDMITVGYNAWSGESEFKGSPCEDYLTSSGIEKVIALAREKDVGVVAMKSMAGGERQDLAAFQAEGVSLPQAKLKWVLSNKAVAGVITEMTTFDMLHENLAVSGRPLSKKEKKVLYRAVEQTWKKVCRMCGSCSSACPSGIDIPEIFRFAAYHEGYGKTRAARAAYRGLPPDRAYPGCRSCRHCETACPFGRAVADDLARAHRLLA